MGTPICGPEVHRERLLPVQTHHGEVFTGLGAFQHFSIGILIISLVMLKGVSHKGIAYLGIVTGVIAILSEAFRPFIGIG